MTPAHEPTSRWFWPGAVLGASVMAFGLWGIVREADRIHPDQLIPYWIGAAVIHDGLLVPAVLAVGWIVARLAGRWRAPVQAALFATAVIGLYSWPFVRGYGRDATDPSALPNNYATGFVAVVAIVVITAGCWAASRILRKPRAPVSRG